ncbi:MAG: protein translocase subunit SecD [Hyphomicrobiaceae bacterium]|nr:protein translocase subunit SecD [Hyphomicrobiaceae bacterium]
MLHFSRLRSLAILGVCLLGVLFALPNMFSRETVETWPSWLPKRQIPPGLDLQGGAHLLLSMDSAQLRKDWLQSLREDARKTLINDAKIAASVTIQGSSVVVKLTKPEEMDRAIRELRRLQEQVGNLALGTSASNIDIKRGDNGLITIAPTEPGFIQRVSNAAGAAIETINRRINALGTAESTVVRQGADRILIQYPGLKDVQKLKDLLGSTAKLTFHEVHPSMTAEDAQQGRAPAGWRVYPSDEPGAPPYLLREVPVVAGEELTDAQPGFDQQTNQPVINFRFNQQGSRKFGRYTQANIGRPFAIVLDDKVISAPVIQSAILGGTGQISGRFTVESATALAVQLRSGALPVKLDIAEERTVGPSLGSDSIAAGSLAGLIGCIATIIMTIAAYGTFGIFAVIALLVNGILIVALMSGIGITLTLPGIAGLVLTIGMAVDANVLIYERIREELRAGRTAISAIEAGFSRAMVTIVDSQLTTLAAALLMFWLGSGPIRGFAVTLSIGIFTSVFTAVVITRYLVALWLKGQRGRPQKIAVPI